MPALLTEKKVLHLPSFITVGGRALREVRLGYETFGKLNAAGDNAILVCHYFSGNSHCAGKYREDDTLPGYWDAIIGPGKPIDTDRFFVVSADTLSNLGAKDPMVTTTGPASIDPDTGKPYGSNFPLLTIRDFVRAQKALLDQLGVKRLHCVAGPSMGAMQTMEWGAQYPDMVQRLLPVIGPGLRAEPFLIAQIDTWAAPILLDPNWRGGDYFGGPEPVAGLRAALKIVTVNARAPGWAAPYERAWHAGDPLAAKENRYRIESALDEVATDRSRFAEAAHLVHLVHTCRNFDVSERGGAVAAITAPTLFISVKSEILMFPAYASHAVDVLRTQGTKAELLELDTPGGHLDGIYEIGAAAEAIRKFLA
ncbi:MAG: homoserine O-acetyltransferase [Burkholderiaceae bacterium]|nr:homoserine O-acetyltransferase [Burkholderiaceae bacterium]